MGLLPRICLHRVSVYRSNYKPFSQVLFSSSSNSTTMMNKRRRSTLAQQPQQHELLEEEENAHELQRLTRIRNVGVFAHVDAGKTTVTERMLALAGVIRSCGNVDHGNTVTDYLPQERERGITISSAAISFPWHMDRKRYDIHLIDTPGHVDFGVEVNRSVAVLDGAVLVLDSVAGVQAQTETVWKACQKNVTKQQSAQQPLPCIAVVNKMDKVGCHFGNAVDSFARKLPGANPIPIQMPLFQTSSGMMSHGTTTNTASCDSKSYFEQQNIFPEKEQTGDFCGVVDLIHMRAIIYPNSSNCSEVETCIPEFVPIAGDCDICRTAHEARSEFLERLAECDETMEEFYLNEQEPQVADIKAALRRVTLNNRGVPVLIAAALRGKGVEPTLDAIVDCLPSPLDRQPPILTGMKETSKRPKLGHPMHPSLVALAFKVVHMKGRGGSGDGRVVFARVYSGELRVRDTVEIFSPHDTHGRKERIGGMLELSGGRFGNLDDAVSKSGTVCALVGLKSVVTGDTIVLSHKKKKHSQKMCLAGVASPKPVLKVRLETESRDQHQRLIKALALLQIEDPSLIVEETESATLLEGLGELHVEVTLDRLKREFGLDVLTGPPTVTYRETITDTLGTDGLVAFKRCMPGATLQGAVELVLKPAYCNESSTIKLQEPTVTIDDSVKEFLNLDTEACDSDLIEKSELFENLYSGCQGALARGPLGSHAMANLQCRVKRIDAEAGLSGLLSMPGSIRAAASHAISSLLASNEHNCRVLEPTMSLEVSLPNDMVGTVLSDLTGSRRGRVADVQAGQGIEKSEVRGEVPLVEILGYATSLRSMTGGEATFSAEYKGHSILEH